MDFPDPAADEISEGKNQTPAREAEKWLTRHRIVKSEILKNNLARAVHTNLPDINR